MLASTGSTCTRTFNANGLLTEVVMLKGVRRDLSDEDLEAFIAKCPIKRA